ncbi:MAG: Dolichyl-phosphate-mannose-protein mannosyltransferase [Betaproteobacteria bacterium ADurb.Bin341]|nr:MAG: Dolichyl-phosphate-mannose-protein mannosyltransferase [Betaproteobacteria bacterium ADurb.Bin341]
MLIRKPQNLTEWLLLLGTLSFIPALFFYLVGEEGIYTISSIEMAHNQTWLKQTLYGADNGRPPLLNWLIVPIAQLIGWAHVVIAARLVSVLATLGMVATVYGLSRRLTQDKSFALFAALTCLCLADLLLYRGWLTYTDPVFAFFTFAAIACLWIAALEKRLGYLLLSILLISAALLTKAFTAYLFFGTALFVLLWQREARRFLLSPAALAIFALTLIVPYLWFTQVTQPGHSAGMASEMLRKLSAQGFLPYLQRLVTYPLQTALELSPPVLLALYLKLRRRVRQEAAPCFTTGLWITFLCFLPYWLAPQGGIRYLLPIYPLIALVCADLIWRSGESARTLALRWFAAVIAVKFVFALILFPWYQVHYRGKNYVAAAQTIQERTKGHPLYVADDRAPALSVVSAMNARRFPQAPLTSPPPQFDSGFVLAKGENPAWGSVAEIYTLAKDQLYLLCKGKACQ